MGNFPVRLSPRGIAVPRAGVGNRDACRRYWGELCLMSQPMASKRWPQPHQSPRGLGIPRKGRLVA